MHLQETEVASARGRVPPWARLGKTMTMTKKPLGNSRALERQGPERVPSPLSPGATAPCQPPKELDLSGTAWEKREGADGVLEVRAGVALSSQKVLEPPS